MKTMFQCDRVREAERVRRKHSRKRCLHRHKRLVYHHAKSLLALGFRSAINPHKSAKAVASTIACVPSCTACEKEASITSGSFVTLALASSMSPSSRCARACNKGSIQGAMRKRPKRLREHALLSSRARSLRISVEPSESGELVRASVPRSSFNDVTRAFVRYDSKFDRERQCHRYVGMKLVALLVQWKR